MVAQARKFLNDYPVARWGALILIALMMFFAYMFVDVLSPLQSLINSQRGWDSSAFGTYASSEYILKRHSAPGSGAGGRPYPGARSSPVWDS